MNGQFMVPGEPSELLLNREVIKEDLIRRVKEEVSFSDYPGEIEFIDSLVLLLNKSCEYTIFYVVISFYMLHASSIFSILSFYGTADHHYWKDYS